MLLGQRRRDCGHATAAPNASGAQCGSPDLERNDRPAPGEIDASTRIAIVPAAFDVPSNVALVDVDESDLGLAAVLG